MLRIGVDVGGTFTDFAAWRDAPAAFMTFKTSSTPPTFIEGFKAGIEEIIARLGPQPGEDVIIMHGTTVSTNTVIERSGSRLALLVTRGFRDILDLQRFRLNEPIRLDAGRPMPLIPRDFVFEIDERLEPDGSVSVPLDPAQVRDIAREAERRGVAGIAVAFLHSYRNPAHERSAADAVAAAAPDLGVSLSADILPRIGEYERTIACVLNAYVKARMSGYLTEVEAYLADRLPAANLFITRSNGGAMAAARARTQPIHTLLSGPASGVTAARFFGEAHGGGKFLTMDMGGTSTDMALILDGRSMVANDAEVGDFPLTMPVTGIEAIGAGGGSIAWLDGAVLRVGPRSAGAWPGPACFGRGGTQPTVTDAYLLCGYIDPEHFLGGRMPLSPDDALKAMAPLAEELGMPVEAAAEACIAVATSNMVARALPYFARHGVDQEELALVLFGGAGSLHGPLLADELGIGRVFVPRTPSVFCAFGGLVSELAHDVVAPVYGVVLDGAELARRFDGLERDARAWLAAQTDTRALTSVNVEHWAEMRYLGQFFSVDVLLNEAAVRSGDMVAIAEAYHAEHERLYDHADRSTEVELLELRLRIAGALPSPPLHGPGNVDPERFASALMGDRTLYLDGAIHRDAPVFARDRLAPGAEIRGPAIIEQADTTILVPPGFTARVQPSADIVMTRAA